MSYGKLLAGNVSESVLCGAYFHAADKFIYGEEFLSSDGVKKAALSGGCQFLSEGASNMILPSLVSLSPGMQSVEDKFLQPVVSGALYVLGDKILRVDGRSWMTKLLHQAGSSAVAKYTQEPVMKVLGM